MGGKPADVIPYEPGLLRTAQRRFVTKGFMEPLTVITLFARTKVQSTTDQKTIKLCFQQSGNAKHKQEHHVIYQLKKKIELGTSTGQIISYPLLFSVL